MVITTIQKVIKIGSSRGVTLPARDLRALGIRDGDEIEVTVRKRSEAADDNQLQTRSLGDTKRIFLTWRSANG